MIWGIHYVITKLKTKIDVIPRAALNISIFLLGIVYVEKLLDMELIILLFIYAKQYNRDMS